MSRKKEKSEFEIEYWPVNRPVPYARNARVINQNSIDKVAASLKEFGWQQPIVVDPDGVIVVGHTRLLAAQKLGMDTVPVKIAYGLSKAQLKAYRLADNRTNDEAKWDYEMAALELGELKDDLGYDLSLTGFDPHEIDPLLATDWSPAPVEDDSTHSGGGDKPDMKAVQVTPEQYDLIMSSIETLRTRENDKTISDGRALELICGNYLSQPDESMMETVGV